MEDGETRQVHEVLKGVNLEIKKGGVRRTFGTQRFWKIHHRQDVQCHAAACRRQGVCGGMDTLDESLLYEIRRRVGLVLQNPDNQLVASIVEEDVAFGPENLGIAPEEIRRRGRRP